MNCIIVEDEPLAEELLRELIAKHAPDFNIMSSANSLEGAQQLLRDHQPDLVFFDIFLNGESTIEWLKTLPRIDFQIIFASSHDQYALDAFNLDAIHYLLKPIDENLFQKAISKIKVQDQGSLQDKILEQLKSIQNSSEQKIAIPSLTGMEFVSQNDISYCQASGSYTEMYFMNGEKKMVSKPIGHFEKNLSSDSFMRVHKKFIINLHQVSFLERGKNTLVYLKNGDKVTISQSYKDAFLEKMKSEFQI